MVNIVKRSHVLLAPSLIAVSILGLAVGSHAQATPSGSMKRSPADVVKRYVLLDQKGARLDAPSFDTVLPYIDWKEEPAWGRVVVVQQTNVPEDYQKWEIINNLEVIIPVTFHVLGAVYLEHASFIPEDTVEEVRFHVKVVKNYWRIISPIIPPHVGLKRMMSFAREAEAKEQNEAHRTELASLIDSLRKAK
ncbi:hypothetical protein YTPLAS72_31110 [Nitrospira sp.]|nr:hypothetical protein YTPLAS72_31110 [Nitrospira sp.]